MLNIAYFILNRRETILKILKKSVKMAVLNSAMFLMLYLHIIASIFRK